MKKFAKFFDFHFIVVCFYLLIFAIVLVHAQPPAWLNPPRNETLPPPPAVVGEGTNPQAGSGNAESIRTRTITKVKHDTITIVKRDTIIKIDTLESPKPLYYNYTIYYEIVNRKIALQKGFLWDFSNTAQKTQLQSSDTTLLSLGNESLREASYTYDPNGNKTQTFEKIIEGLDMRVNGSSVNITYRTASNLLSLNGRFDRTGLLMLSSDFSKRRYLFNFIPLDFLFGSEKYTLFLRVEKTEVK